MMEYGKEVAVRFLVLMVVGFMVLITSLVAVAMPVFTFRLGQPNFPWMTVFGGSGLLLCWSGFVGMIASSIPRSDLSLQETIKIAIGLHIAFLGLYLWSLYDFYDDIEWLVLGQSSLDQVLVLALLLVALTLITFRLSFAQLMRLYRQRRRR